MANTRQNIVFGLLVALLGAALFVIASAYMVDRDLGKVPAAITGVLAFPVLPAAWQLVGERRRRARIAAAKTPPKSSLTGHDRYWMRFVLVAAVVLGPMIAVSRFDVARAVWRHGLWFVPASSTTVAAIGGGGDVAGKLHRVPAEAELVVLFHEDAEHGHPAGDGVLAWGAHQGMVVADPSFDAGKEPMAKQLDAFNAGRSKMEYFTLADTAVELPTTDKTVMLATEGWRSKITGAPGPSPELRDELARAPAGALFVAAFAPKTPTGIADLDAATIRHGVVWAATGKRFGLEVAGIIEARDDAAAGKLVADLKAALRSKLDAVPSGCRDEVKGLGDVLKFEQTGSLITVRADATSEGLASLLMCALTTSSL